MNINRRVTNYPPVNSKSDVCGRHWRPVSCITLLRALNKRGLIGWQTVRMREEHMADGVMSGNSFAIKEVDGRAFLGSKTRRTSFRLG